MKISPSACCGVDYGSKMAGTTVVSYVAEKTIFWTCSAKNQDADAWLLNAVAAQHCQLMLLDAPLSLPAVYRAPEPTPDADFFYRAADRSAGAMSPMFLGGLTARAIRLKTQLATQHVAVLEAYPAAVAKLLQLDVYGYKKATEYIPAVQQQLLTAFAEWDIQAVASMPPHWHAIDAQLALLTALRYLHGQATCIGMPDEGLIWV